eukprot:jgi/Botrbrau1/1017/Bobra.114_1s0055.1
MAAPAGVTLAETERQTDRTPQNGRVLEDLLLNTSPCLLEPARFFVSWQGVLTLAFRGFPPALLQLKQDIGDRLGGLPRENPGSLWPKCSLGALRDNKRLDPQQLALLNRICLEESASFADEGSAILVDHACVLLYECRCLEKLISRQRIPFYGAPANTAEGGQKLVDGRGPAPEEVQRVMSILQEADQPDYWFAASKDGNRETHYRGTALGATLAFRLEDSEGWALPMPREKALAKILERIDAFRARVEGELGDMYALL